MSTLFSSVVLETLNYCLPETILTSKDIENRLTSLYDRLKLPQGRLELMTGIESRRIWPRGIRPSDLSIDAGKGALLQSNIQKEDIGVLIHASVCRDYLEPATASRVHHGLGLPSDTLVFDVSNACLGVLNAWILLAHMIERGQVKAGMVVAGENAGPLLEETMQTLLQDPMMDRKTMKKYFANLTIGSGAFASVLCHKDLSPHSPRLLGGSYLNDTEASGLCQGGGDLHSLQMETDSEKLLLAGIELSQKTWERTKQILNWQNETPDHVVTHQVGVAHSSLLFDKLRIDHRKDFSTYPFLGNTGSVALPITLTMGKNKGLYRSGDRLALLGIGSGLNSIMLGVEWNSL